MGMERNNSPEEGSFQRKDQVREPVMVYPLKEASGVH
jgi:hypothetical protein